MKKSATSNYAGFIRIEKDVQKGKKISPSVKSSKSSDPNIPSPSEFKVTSWKNADSVYNSGSTGTRKSTGRSEPTASSTRSKPKAMDSKVSPSPTTKKSHEKEKTSTDKRSSRSGKPATSPKGETQKRSKDVSFVHETKSKFKSINENLMKSEDIMDSRTPEKKSKRHPNPPLSVSHTEQFERTLVMTEPRVESPSSGRHSAHRDSELEDITYEDDFEDYESDFESFSNSMDEDSSDTQEDMRDSSDTQEEMRDTTQRPELLPNNDSNFLKVSKNTEEEKKLDSGVYELTMVEKKQRNEMQNIRKVIEEENAQMVARIQHGSQETNHDEDSSLDLSNRFEFINFEEALRLESNKKKSVKRKKRSDYLLDMIKLDQLSFVIYDAPPIPYEAYIKCYGRSNTQQVLVQTHEEDLDEEVQTEAIDTRTKWTQCPISFNLSNVKTVQQLRWESSGVGQGEDRGDARDSTSGGYDIGFGLKDSSACQSLEKIGEIIISLLEEEASHSASEEDQNFHSGIFENNSRDLKFSDQFISLGVDRVPYLTSRPVKQTLFCKKSELKLITVHEKQSRSPTSELHSRCILCEWNISQPSAPLALMVANSDVTCVACEEPSLVFAGMKDGSLSVWDLRERMINVRDEVKLRTPSYNTAAIVNKSAQIYEQIVSIQIVNGDEKNDGESNQLLSLDQSGTLNLWTIFRSTNTSFSQKSKHFNEVDLGQSFWGNIRLILLKTVQTNQNSRSLELEYTCMTILNQEVFLGASNGIVQHLSMTSSSCMPSSYLSNTDEQLGVKCIEHCPYEKDYFLVGYSNGQIKMYNRRREKPLISFAGTGNPGVSSVDVKYICWSKHRLGLFFVLDSESRLHMWDLCKSDMYPLYSIPLQSAQVMNIDLSPNCLGSVQSSFLVLGTCAGRVEVHRIKKELGRQTESEFRKDKNKFLKYVSIL